MIAFRVHTVEYISLVNSPIFGFRTPVQFLFQQDILAVQACIPLIF